MEKEKQKQEALKRMEMMNFHTNARKEYDEEDIINASVNGLLFWLDEEEKEWIKQWESETGNVVYHVIKSNTNIGELWSILYVSKYEEEWEFDREYIEKDIVFAYVRNLTMCDCSEYGSIGIKQLFGGLVRVS